MKLNELRDNEGAVKDRMRVARGIGSGKGKDWWPWCQRSEVPFRRCHQRL